MDDTDLPIPTPPPESGVSDPSHIVRGKLSMNCVLILPGDSENSSRVVTAVRLQPCGTFDQDLLHEILLQNVPFWNRLAESSQQRPALERRNAAALPSEKDKKEKQEKPKKENAAAQPVQKRKTEKPTIVVVFPSALPYLSSSLLLFFDSFGVS